MACATASMWRLGVHALRVYAARLMSQPAATAEPLPWLQAVGDVLDEALWTWDARADRVVFTNAAFRRQFGALPDLTAAAGSQLLLDHVHEQDREAWSSAYGLLADVKQLGALEARSAETAKAKVA